MKQSQQILFNTFHNQVKNEINKVGKYKMMKSKYGPRAALSVDEAGLKKLYSLPIIRKIEEDIILRSNLNESIPIVRAEDTWNGLDVTGTDNTIVILDTGVDSNHPMLSGRVIDGACFSTNDRTDSLSSLCPDEDNNGIGDDNGFGVEAGEECEDISGCGHGTHVAGIAAGRSSPYLGVAKNANIISIQIFSRDSSKIRCKQQGDSAPCINIRKFNATEALSHVVDISNQYDIASINMSFGGGYYNSICNEEDLDDLTTTLSGYGIFSVAASGNDAYQLLF